MDSKQEMDLLQAEAEDIKAELEVVNKRIAELKKKLRVAVYCLKEAINRNKIPVDGLNFCKNTSSCKWLQCSNMENNIFCVEENSLYKNEL